MKNTLSKILIWSGIIFSLNSCKKQEQIQTSKTSTATALARSNDVTFREISVAPTDLINSNNYLDDNDEKIRCGQYELTRAFIESVTPAQMNSIFELIKSTGSEDILYSDVFAQFPELATAVDEKIASGDNYGLPYNFSSFDDIQSALTREEFTYASCIHLANNGDNEITSLDTAHILFSAGLEYGDTDETYSDDYHSFYLHAGQLSNIRISEAEANNTTNPMLVTSLTVTTYPTGNSGTAGAKTTSPAWLRSDLNFKLMQFKGWDRHENDKHSEIHVCGKAAVYSGSSIYIKNLFGNWFNNVYKNESRECAIIHKNDFNGSIRNLNGQNLYIYNWNPSNIMMEHYTTIMQVFERDWAASWKRFGYFPTTSNSTYWNADEEHCIWGRATYASDYYYVNPEDNNGSTGTAIDDAKKDYVYQNNGQWQGSISGLVLMKIQ